ncbi:ABC-type nitrate/sulfonate/bicarbonate transport system permease component [Thermosporothrix hazakensis]|jgi:ABC-type nitrate/sulfonate/bicarbonate transport system permease component|uniref:ABC-type nitrate/sulfonate/bicarbonate transport system permease component n=2 Tax=Thermosporothrix TaxID=768650 RepID=A0A326U8W1_THEHA|nr:ABC transporter permease [Thermosporothrix hazakensis]PZW31260.1 ABC-type nitrate/sulfonate/bicarbonate transport system permease component [Thermosporothrix hazakensis]BBH86515.1 ABC transporter permease [Thermosporothrix sp. COM3]GCE50826.1 ABC transporter permease [Thermosporothrix hazakensis]
MKRSWISLYGPAMILALVLLLGWQMYTRIGNVNPLVLPAPTEIITTLGKSWDTLFDHTVYTLMETVLGLALATICALVLALIMDLVGVVRRALYPLLILSQTIPIVALAPLLRIWFGFDMGPKILVVILFCFFPITVACIDGLEGTPGDLIKLLRSMKASRWQQLWFVRLPGALPSFFSGLRIAATYAPIAAIFGEIVGAEKGLGIFMQFSLNARATAQVFASIVILSLLSLFLFGFVILLERLALPWYHSTTASNRDGDNVSRKSK